MKTRKRYKSTFLAILISILLTFHVTATFAQSDKTYLPQKVRLTNVRDTQFTISWITKGSIVGKINYGPTPGLGKTAYDERGDNTQGRVHHITVRHLKPNTLYYFEIVSGNKTYKNSNELYTCQTGPSIIPAKCDVAYGRVYEKIRKQKVPYSKEAVVYLTLIDAGAAGSAGSDLQSGYGIRQSAMESTLLEENGYWSRELANFREKHLLQLFNYSDSGDTLKIEVQTVVYPETVVTVDTGSDSPAEDIELMRKRIKE